jgi:hypothetical protein
MRYATVGRGEVLKAGAVSQEDTMNNLLALEAPIPGSPIGPLSWAGPPNGDRTTTAASLVAPPRRSGGFLSGRPCPHHPPCPSADAIDHEAAHLILSVPEQGWSLRCNGVITFDDTGELLPDRRAVPPHRGPALHRSR